MGRVKVKNKPFKSTAEFDPSKDTPLRYFSTNSVFVRLTRAGNYGLYCDGYNVLRFDKDGFLYTFPTYHPSQYIYVDSFIHDYAPHITTDKIVSRLGKLDVMYTGLPEYTKV